MAVLYIYYLYILYYILYIYIILYVYIYNANIELITPPEGQNSTL